MKDIVARSKKSRASIARYLRLARAAHLIEFVGAPKTGGYHLTAKIKTLLH
jgi:ATP-dependent DNA helicase RecG